MIKYIGENIERILGTILVTFCLVFALCAAVFCVAFVAFMTWYVMYLIGL